MQTLFFNGSIQSGACLEWRETDRPTLNQPGDAIVQPLAVAACDLDRSIAAGRSPMTGPFPIGHEFTARVLETGPDVKSLSVGAVVLASFQPSCGTCARCGHGHSSVCEAVPRTSMYGLGTAGGDWSGAFSDALRVPWADYNLRPVPEGLDLRAIASASDNLADGLRGVDVPLARRPGASVLIAGSGSIPLYAIICARHLGAGRVTFASQDRYALEVAESIGAECLPIDKWPKKLMSHDITIDCTNDVTGLSTVLRSTAPYGDCTSSSIYFRPSVPVPMLDMNMKGISFHTGRVNSASQLDRVLDLLQEGLNPELIQPAYHPFEAAIDALQSEPESRKVILTRE